MKIIYFTLVTFLFLGVSNAQTVTIPNTNFKAKLLQASTTNTIASAQTPIYNSILGQLSSVSSFNKIDTNNDGQIQVSEASVIKYLDVRSSNISSLVGINDFINLKALICNSNQLLSLNIDSLSSLIYLDCDGNLLSTLTINTLNSLNHVECSGNQIQSLNLSGLSNLQVLKCFANQMISLNVSGLTNLTSLDCQNNQLTSLDVSALIGLVDLLCMNNQLSSLNLNINGINNLQYLNCSFNQLISLDLSDLSRMTQFRCYNNQLTSLDLTGLTKLDIIECFNNQLTSLDVSDSIFLYYLDCNNNQLLNLSIKNNNLFWNVLNFQFNPNLTYVCCDEDDITLVQQKIIIYNYLNCNANSYCSFTPGGIFYTIQGNQKIDLNFNGCDALDPFYSNLKFNLTNGTVLGSIISNNLGNYYIPVPSGNHTITPQFENFNYFSISPTSATVSFPSSSSPYSQNFCVTPNGVHHDLEVVVVPIGVARPGFDTKYKIKYKNKGTVSETATLVFNFNDAVLDYVSSTLVPTSVSTASLSWNIGTITPFQSGEFLATLNVNSPIETPAVNAGDTLSYTAVINELNTDETPIDNTFTLRQTVVNSFDPNDKKCLEGTTINPNMIGEYVHYQVRFENTGTFPAQNIVVKDLIDTTKFDLSTLQMTDASHSCITRITNPNKVEFIFENINLPFDDANNDGYLVFKIKTKTNLVTGNTISNSANIYFDYNYPITTNTATSTFQVLANTEFERNQSLILFPNPTKNVLNFSIKNTETATSLSIYNLLGQIVQTVLNPSEPIDVSRLQTGIYILKISTENGMLSGRFEKQ